MQIFYFRWFPNECLVLIVNIYVKFNMKHIIFGVQLFVLISCGYAETIVSLGRTNVNEWFSKQIVPSMFNLTLEQSDQFEFEFSLRGYPNLPSWIQFMYSTEYNAGYLYGTPPDKVAGHEVMLIINCSLHLHLLKFEFLL